MPIDIEQFPPQLLTRNARDLVIRFLHSLVLTPDARKRHFAAWARYVGYRPTQLDFLALES